MTATSVPPSRPDCAGRRRRTPLTRRTPLQSATTLIPARSHKRSAQERACARLRPEWMAAHPWCERCGAPATDLHHRKGRTGALLCDSRWFAALCAHCHQHTHDQPAESYRTGLMLRRTA